MRMRRRTLALASAFAAALVLPSAAWAPWETISDTAVNVIRVCSDGIELEVADVLDHEATSTTPVSIRLGIVAGEPEAGTNKPPPTAPLVLDTTLSLPHAHVDIPAVGARHFYGKFLLPWSTAPAVGAATRLIFNYPDSGDITVDLPFSSAPALTVESCRIFGGTAVRLRSFTARRAPTGVALRWRTAAEVGTLGFHLYRETARGVLRLNRSLIPARGEPARGHSYTWLDRAAPRARALRYRLQEVALDGSKTWRAVAVLSLRS